MRKVTGIGETVYDIVFRDGQPQAAVPGGSTFNSMISVGRCGIPASFLSEVGSDKIGEIIKDFLTYNGVSTASVNTLPGKTPLSLAFLNENDDAEYSFYRDSYDKHPDFTYPELEKDDIVIFGSFYALNPKVRPQVRRFLEYARSREAIIYYDINFRSSHASEAIKLRSTILENFEYASIVRGSTEDFQNMFKISDPEKAYEQEVKYHCKQMLCTDAEGDICLFSPNVTKKYQVNKIETVSTIGAGDNFNAGIVFGLLKEGVSRDGIASITEEQWNRIIAHGMAFAAEVCQSLNNSISKEFAKNYGRI